MAADFSQVDLGPKMAALRPREQQFVWHYVLNGGNGAQAARDAGYSDAAEGAKVRAHALLHSKKVLDAVMEMGLRTFRGLLVPAVAAARALIEKPDHPDHAKMVNSVLDRVGPSVRSGIDLNMNVSGEVTVNHTDAALGDLRMLLAMGVPRQKLEDTFGASGLLRYERMLAEQDGRAPKMIEGEVVRHEDGR
jgi:hypothetical protein